MQDESDISASYTPLPTRTKYGRSINKPVLYTPALPSAASPLKRRRYNRRTDESGLCKICKRGHSPAGNLIVFCDACNTAYHQFCHHPPIDADVVASAQTEWLCSTCGRARQFATESIKGLVPMEALTIDEVKLFCNKKPADD